MSRAALNLVLLTVVLAGSAASLLAAGPNPHLDPSTISGMCGACHDGHGVSRSPMLPDHQVGVCLSCHGNRSSFSDMVARGQVTGDADPPLLDSALALPYQHPIDDQAFSHYDFGVVTCTSCHSPHRGMPEPQPNTEASGRARMAPNDPSRFEYELCESCHGSSGAATQSLTDISRLLSPENRSYHPVEAAAVESSPSIIEALRGRQVNCTDCHGNSDPSGPSGPHSSEIPYLLRFNYVTTDGSDEAPEAYALCYRCHEREVVLDSPLFPEHDMHITKRRASCATCHNPHGSVDNRALIGFGEETTVGGVAPSASGRLEFVSDGPGSGACYLNCHGEDHDPEAYGTMKVMLKMLGRDLDRSRPIQGPVSNRGEAER